MVKYYFILFSLIYSINAEINNQQSCSVCELDAHFNQSNGYGCFVKSVNETLCTCPDRVWITNQPCRICSRKGICGPSTAVCAERNLPVSTKYKVYFGCSCSSGLLLLNEKCPEDTSSSTTIDTIAPNPSTSATKMVSTPYMETTPKCDHSSHLFVEPILIILLNLVYFVNK